MNKQEAIEKVEEYRGSSLYIKDYVKNIIYQIDEPQNVVIPKYVADWIEECKNREGYTLSDALSENLCPSAVDNWFYKSEYVNENVFAHAWLFGYEIEKEKLYKVSIVDNLVINDTLTRNKDSGIFSFSIGDDTESELFTKAELEGAGFGSVFDNDMFEVQEVE